MYYCNTCGQCSLFNNENFIELADISGTEKRYVNCVSGDVEDYGDSDTECNGDVRTYCPYCDNDDIDFEWEGIAEEAFSQRAVYEMQKQETIVRLDKISANERSKVSGWDSEENL